MPELQVRIALPYYLRISQGEYETGKAGESLQVVAPQLVENEPPRTSIQARFTHDEIADADGIQRLKIRDADQLLWRTNRLLRWYRSVTRRADVSELTRAQASPFSFEVLVGAFDPAWSTPLPFEGGGPQPLPLPPAELNDRVSAGLGSGNEPDVAELFILDAESALHQGRFRETVLFCWSTIDSVFNRKYDALVRVALAAEWAQAREFFTGGDFGLKNKMSAALYLVANRSLFREPNNFWQKLSESYNKRNTIIHRGANANEDEARQAIDVAQCIVSTMNSIAVPEPPPAAPAVIVPPPQAAPG